MPRLCLEAAERLLYVRFRLGTWDPPSEVPFADKSVYGADIDMTPWEDVSLDAARQSMVSQLNGDPATSSITTL